MENETQNVQQQIPADVDFSDMELSAVAEIQNISMGSAATAVSNLLNEKVLITTPKVRIIKSSDIKYPNLEPSVQVKINYTKGVTGTNTMVLKQDDVQLMLNQLMGLPLEVTDDFVFDEMNISAVCEVMNQMMGSSATAVSEFLNIPIDISTPEATVHDLEHPYDFADEETDGYVVEIHFNLSIGQEINSEFISVIGIDLAKTLASSMLQGFDNPTESTEPEMPKPAEKPVEHKEPVQQTPQKHAEPLPPDPMYQQQQQMYQQQPQQQPQQPAQPMYQQQPNNYQQPMYQQPYQPQGYQQQMYQQPVYQQAPVNVQGIQLHQFDVPQGTQLTDEQQDNLSLLMGVPLDISIELGKAKKKVKEILEFTQGTVIELDKQAGAPVDIIVNGHLIARGDVVVIDDNFAVRVTEIVKSRFLDSLGNKE